MKKLLALCLSLALLCTLAACSGESTGTTNGGITSNGSTTANTSTNTGESNATVALEFYQDGDTVTAVLTGEIISFYQEKEAAGEHTELRIELRNSDSTAGYFMLRSGYSAYAYTPTSGSEYAISLNTSEDAFVFTASNFDVDLVTDVRKVETEIYYDGDYYYEESFFLEELSITQGAYQAAAAANSEDYPFVGCYLADGGDGYVSGELTANAFGYVFLYDGNTYQLGEHTYHSSTEGVVEYFMGTASENADLSVEVKLVYSDDPENPVDSVGVELFENDSSILYADFTTLAIQSKTYYAYDEDNNKVSDALEVAVDGASIQLTILGKYQTEWIALESGMLYKNNLSFDGKSVTNLATGEVYTIRFVSSEWEDYDENDYEYLVYDYAQYKIYDAAFNIVDGGVLLSYLDTEYEDFALIKEGVMGSYVNDATGDMVEITSTQLIINDEVYDTIDLDVFAANIALTSAYPIVENGEMVYCLDALASETQMYIGLYDVQSESYILSASWMNRVEDAA